LGRPSLPSIKAGAEAGEIRVNVGGKVFLIGKGDFMI